MVNIELAGFPVQFNNRFSYLENFCRGYETAEKPIMTLSASPEEMEQERAANPGNFSDGYLEAVCLYRNLALEILKQDVFLLHASVIEVDAEGYAFLAPSGTGKTTQTRLWLEYFGTRARVINGDKPLIRVFPRGNSWEFVAYGTPWQGKEGMGCKACVPLKALFLLERSPEPSCEPASQEYTVDHIFRQLLMPRQPDQMDRLFTLIDRFVETVPCYILRCNMKLPSVEAAYGAANS